jgi:hypothetical protein
MFRGAPINFEEKYESNVINGKSHGKFWHSTVRGENPTIIKASGILFSHQLAKPEGPRLQDSYEHFVICERSSSSANYTIADPGGKVSQDDATSFQTALREFLEETSTNGGKDLEGKELKESMLDGINIYGARNSPQATPIHLTKDAVSKARVIGWTSYVTDAGYELFVVGVNTVLRNQIERGSKNPFCFWLPGDWKNQTVENQPLTLSPRIPPTYIPMN